MLNFHNEIKKCWQDPFENGKAVLSPVSGRVLESLLSVRVRVHSKSFQTRVRDQDQDHEVEVSRPRPTTVSFKSLRRHTWVLIRPASNKIFKQIFRRGLMLTYKRPRVKDCSKQRSYKNNKSSWTTLLSPFWSGEGIPSLSNLKFHKGFNRTGKMKVLADPNIEYTAKNTVWLFWFTKENLKQSPCTIRFSVELFGGWVLTFVWFVIIREHIASTCTW